MTQYRYAGGWNRTATATGIYSGHIACSPFYFLATPFDRAASVTPAAAGEAGGKYAFKTQSISNTPRSHVLGDTRAGARTDVEYVAAPQGKIGRAFAHYHARPLLDARHR